MSEAYKTAGPGHVYRGRCQSRGHRQRSKVLRGLKGMATLGFIEEVFNEDLLRFRRDDADEQEKRLVGALRAQ
jgi:hypothetical protein